MGDGRFGFPSRRDLGAAGLVLALMPSLSSIAAAAVSPPRPKGAEGFDFLLGSWDVRHRRLRDRLAGSSDWIEFPGTLVVRPILGGLGDIDENVLESPDGPILATSLRVFDAASGQWSIYWIDARSPGLDPPVVGKFEGREGRFYNEDVFQGRPIRVRFIYEDLSPSLARWSQSFSPDKGESWEVNWTMDFRRTESP